MISSKSVWLTVPGHSALTTRGSMTNSAMGSRSGSSRAKAAMNLSYEVMVIVDLQKCFPQPLSTGSFDPRSGGALRLPCVQSVCCSRIMRRPTSDYNLWRLSHNGPEVKRKARQGPVGRHPSSLAGGHQLI